MTSTQFAQSTKSGNALLYLVKKVTGGTTLAEKQEASMWGLIIASSVCGLLFGRYFNTYALIPAALVLAGIAYFLASKQGLAIGVLSLVLATVAMQLCYLLSAVIIIFMDNFEPAKAPSEEFL
jgi:ABC-type Fe3+-siderophore transport system permease subunit